MEEIDIDALDSYVYDDSFDKAEYPNPFFLKTVSKLKYEKSKDLKETYEDIYIVCLSNVFQTSHENKTLIKKFSDPNCNVSEELLDESHLFTLIKAPFQILKEFKLRDGLLTISKKHLHIFNNNDYQLPETVLTLLMLESRESDIKQWLSYYDPVNSFSSFIRQKLFATFYNITDQSYQDGVLKNLDTIADFKYWQDSENLNLTINKEFIQRKFNTNFAARWTTGNNMKAIMDIIKDNQNVPMGYPSELTHPRKSKKENKDSVSTDENYKNIESDTKKSYYKVTNPEENTICREDIEALFLSNCLTEKDKYYLLCHLLISKSYADYVLNNEKILVSVKPLFKKYNSVFRYLMGYAWMGLHMEESIKKTNITAKDRCVFNLETASKLPVYPFSPDNPQFNPYFTHRVGKKQVNYKKNLLGVKFPFDQQLGLVSIDEFKRRMNIFLTGTEEIDLLAGADWSNMCLSGSLMAATLPKSNPLMLNVRANYDGSLPMTVRELDAFFSDYYSNADVDMACNHNNLLDFIDHVSNIKTILAKNLKVSEDLIKIEPYKTLSIFLSENRLKELCSSDSIPFSYDHIINNRSSNEVKFYFYEKYITHKTKTNIKTKEILGDKINQDEYFELVNYCTFDKVNLIINDFSFDQDIAENMNSETNSGIELTTISEDYIKFSETLKLKIRSTKLKHSFEFFRIAGQEFFSTVARYHLPCVRSYYNGTTCLLLPSAITAYHTLTNYDFRYFVGSYDPFTILQKYRMRGYGVILNNNELEQYVKYVLINPSLMKKYNISTRQDIDLILGSMPVFAEYLKPNRRYKKHDYNDNNLATITSNTDYKFSEYTTIGNDGNVTPLKKWIIDAGFDIFQKAS